MGQSLGNLDDLLLGDGQVAAERFRIDGHSDAIEQLPAAAVFAGDGQPTEPAAFLPQEDVLPRGQRRHEVELLVDDADTGPPSRRGSAELNGASVDFDRTGVRRDGSAQDLDQRALAGPVFAHQGQHFAGVQIQVHAAQGPHAGIGLFDSPHPQQRWGISGRSSHESLESGVKARAQTYRIQISRQEPFPFG